jgi:hypothetical protein
MRLRVLDSLTTLREEVAAQAERWSLWTPVAFGLGAAAYLQLRVEPPLWRDLGPGFGGRGGGDGGAPLHRPGRPWRFSLALMALRLGRGFAGQSAHPRASPRRC